MTPAGPSPVRVVAVLLAVALVVGLWWRYGANVGAGAAVGVFLVWGVGRWFKR